MKFKTTIIALAFITTMFIPVSLTWAETPVKIHLYSSPGEHERPYFVIFLVNANNRYVKTLAVIGDDKKYFDAFRYWYRYSKSSGENIDALSGPSINNGTVFTQDIVLPDDAITNGYKIRIDASGEFGDYVPKEAIVKLTNEINGQKTPGKQYMEYITLKW